ncbi:hypothetical protein, partial [Micromonospora sp. NPDC048843]|uniref:hypothetical protein n=1 Tax=Micromonospora sp. NPDC048843 TaxID=3155389 RepID=UPI0033E61934
MTTSYPVGGGSWGPGPGSRWRGSADPTGAGAPGGAGGAFGPGGPPTDATGTVDPPRSVILEFGPDLDVQPTASS